MIPLNERAGYSQIMALSEVAELTRIEREKFLQKLTLLAEAEDELALTAQKVADTGGCAIRLRNKGLASLARFVLSAIIAAPDELVNQEIRKLRDFAEKDLAAAAEREQRRVAAEQSDAERRIVAEAEAMGVGEILAAVETNGARLELRGNDQIIIQGGSLNQRQRIFVNVRRRQILDALRGRQHAEVV
jgi:hypothetical protein